MKIIQRYWIDPEVGKAAWMREILEIIDPNQSVSCYSSAPGSELCNHEDFFKATLLALCFLTCRILLLTVYCKI